MALLLSTANPLSFLASPVGITGGVQIRDNSGESFVYFGLSYGGDLPGSLIDFPTLSYSHSYTGDAQPGAFLTYSVTGSLITKQSGTAWDMNGRSSRIGELGVASSLVGGSVQVGLVFPTGIVFQVDQEDCIP